jgi:aryl-alcohol dehydrogenase-like predicted oxidoreductase
VRKNAEEELRYAYEQYGYGTTIWSPLTGGLLSGKYNDLTPPEDSRYATATPINQFFWQKYLGVFGEEGLKERLHGLKEIADELGCTQAQLCIAWILVNKDISTIIIGASRPEQIEANVQAIEVAQKWTPELEERVSKLLDNTPETAMDFSTWQSKAPRRSISVDFNFGN